MIACPFCNRGIVCQWCKGTYMVDEKVLETFTPPSYSRGLKVYYITVGTAHVLVIAMNSAWARSLAGVPESAGPSVSVECLGVYLGPRHSGVLP